MRKDILTIRLLAQVWLGIHVSAGLACLQDFTEFLHDVDDRAVAGPVDLTENGSKLLHSFGSGPQLPGGHSWLLQHLSNTHDKVRDKAKADHGRKQKADQMQSAIKVRPARPDSRSTPAAHMPEVFLHVSCPVSQLRTKGQNRRQVRDRT